MKDFIEHARKMVRLQNLAKQNLKQHSKGVIKMARPIDKKAVKARIKASKAAATEAKKIVDVNMKAAMKGEGAIDGRATRAAISDFIKAASAMKVDMDLLPSAV